VADQAQKRGLSQATANVVLAVVITAAVAWFAKGGRAPDCSWEPDVDARPAECTVNYKTWVSEAFPNQSYVDRFSLDGSDSALLDACASFVWATIRTPTDWAQELQDGGFGTVPDRVIDACAQYANDHGL
jgi:hypothetical protein